MQLEVPDVSTTTFS